MYVQFLIKTKVSLCDMSTFSSPPILAHAMATWSHPLLRRTPLFSRHPRPFFRFSSFSTSINQRKCKHSFIRCTASMEESAPSTLTQSEIPITGRNSNWKPMCLYYTQGKCTMVNARIPSKHVINWLIRMLHFG